MSTTLTSFKWGERTYIMGILNVTPDSFSGDGVMVEEDVIAKAVAQAKQFVADGADIIDIGGESTRPGSSPISAEEELARVLPVVQAVRQAVDVVISIDSYRASVAEAALAAGASWLNDVWGLRMDPDMAGLNCEIRAYTYKQLIDNPLIECKLRLAHHRHGLAEPARLHLQDAEAGFLAVEGDQLDEPFEMFVRRQRARGAMGARAAPFGLISGSIWPRHVVRSGFRQFRATVDSCLASPPTSPQPGEALIGAPGFFLSAKPMPSSRCFHSAWASGYCSVNSWK